LHDGLTKPHALAKTVLASKMELGDFNEERHIKKDIRILVTKLSKYLVFLGAHWFKHHGILHNGENELFKFKSKFYHDYY
jgi:hypothetical protein